MKVSVCNRKHFNTQQWRKFLPEMGMVFITTMSSSQVFSQTNAPQSNSVASNFALEETLVTAQKRSENVQDVPISISVLSESFIDDVGAQSVNDIGIFTPGFETRVTQATQPSYNIRGIKTNDFGIGVDPAVAVYVDGVYSGRSGAAMTAFQDVNHVEVLKGPQGTLFGKNAAAGAIHIISNSPTDEFEGRVRVKVGNYNQQKIDATVNVPITNELFLRVNVMDNQRDGYRKNLTTGKDAANNNNGGARAALLWDASDDTSVTLRAEYSDVDQDAGVLYSLLNPGNPYGDARYDALAVETLTLWGGSLTVETNVSDMLLTSITAGKSFESNNLRDEDGSDNASVSFTSENIEDNEFYSQELRLTSNNDSNLRWTVGAMYSKEDAKQGTELVFSTDLVDRALLSSAEAGQALARYNQISGEQYTAQTAPAGMGFDILLDQTGANIANWGTPLGGGQSLLGMDFPELVTGELDSTSAALYGDMTYTVTDALDLTFGLRYTKDEKDYTIEINPNSFGFNLAYTTTPRTEQSESWENLSWRVVSDYKFAEDAMAYFSVATGYKAGGFNNFQVAPPFNEEQVINYELGLKSTWLDQRLQFNAAAYYYEYTDLQNLATVSNPTSGLNELKIRSVDAEGQGVELSVVFLATENLTFNANYTFLETEITKFQLFDGEKASNSRLGKPLSQFADHKVNVSAQYALSLGSTGDINFRLDYSYVGDSEPLGIGGVSPGAQMLMAPYLDDLNGDYQNINARITYSDPSDTYQVALYGQNLTDEERLDGLGSIGAVGAPVAERASPRFYGVEVVYNF